MELKLSVEGKNAPIILDHAPVINLRTESRNENVYQKSCSFTVSGKDGAIWSSGNVESRDCIGIPCGGSYAPLFRLSNPSSGGDCGWRNG